MPRIDIVLLGEPTIVVDGEERVVKRRREQTVLARLALAAPSVVSIDMLIEDVWGERPPATAVDALRVHVSSLRKVVAGAGIEPANVIVTRPRAYRMDLASDAVDVHRLETAVRDHDVDTLRSLLRRWVDHDLGNLDSGSGFFTAAAQHTVDLRTTASEIVAEADIDEKHPERAIGMLEEVVRREPYRERSWELLVRSLHHAGRRTEALRTVQVARRALTEVGMETGPGLAAAEEDVLTPERSVAAVRPPSDYVDVDGSRIAFTTLGSSGPDLLFLHGGFVPFEVMPDEPRFARFLQQMASRHRVILLDRRGIGMSDPPADGNPVSLDHWIADCRAVLDAVGSRQCHVLAHENGGPVAIRLAAEDPDRVLGLVLHSTVAKFLRSHDHPYGPTEDAYVRINRIVDRLPGADDVLKLVAPSVGEDPGLRAWLERAGRLGAGPTRAKELHRVYLGVDVRPSLKRVQAPTVVLQPARITRGDPGQAHHLVEHLPNAELQMLDSADHLPFLADANTILETLRRLVDRTTSPAKAAPRELRALLGVSPPVGAEVIRRHDPQAVIELDTAIVGVFTSLASARRCADALIQQHPQATTIVEASDTSGTAEDESVLAVAASASRSHGN